MSLPVYKQIESYILNAIAEGIYKENEMIESETELTKKFNVSRMTARKALDNLVNNGFLYRRKGKGTFVSSQKFDKSINALTSTTEDWKLTGKKLTNNVAKFKKKIPDEEVKKELGIKPDDEVYKVERIRYVDNKPMSVEVLFTPVSIFPDLTKEVFEDSFYKYVEEDKGFVVSHSKQTVEAAVASDFDNELDVEYNDALLIITHTSYLNDSRAFEYVKTYYRADMHKFTHLAYRVHTEK